MIKKRLTFDFESRSVAPLKTFGAYKYSLDPTTQPTCLAIKIHGRRGMYFFDFDTINKHWSEQSSLLKKFILNLISEGYEWSGHNVFFDMCLYKNILVARLGWPDIPFNLFRCTAAKAAACALPRNLAGAGEALNLTVQKDWRGYGAMMKTCKPTKDWVKWNKIDKRKTAWTKSEQKTLKLGEPPMFLEPEDAPDVWATLYEYCKIDVRTEELLDNTLPDLIPDEQEIWHLNQKLNWNGLRVDLPVVRKIVGLLESESKIKLKELDALTMGLVTKPGSRKSILEFLALDGIELPDIKAQTVNDAIKGGGLTSDMKRLLEIRQALSKTSTKKYYSMINRANLDDERVRDILMYHGASTGRDTGTGLQPHNFPRPLIKQNDIEFIIRMLKSATTDPSMVDFIRALYGEPGIVFSSLLRGMIIPTKGKELFVADFSKIEVAVLWWLAGNTQGLEILESGKDPYKYQASANTGLPYESVEDDSQDRQLGKAQVLGCGFGMGWSKFQKTAWDQYRLKLTRAQSKKAVTSYREANAAVPELWKAFEAQAIAAVENGGTQQGVWCMSWSAGKCTFQMRDNFLWVTLPSGRSLAYRDPQISWRVREYEVEIPVLDKHGHQVYDADGEEVVTFETRTSQPMKTLEFMAVNSKTKKWSLERTWGGTLTENIVQAVARDLMMRASVNLDRSGYNFLLAVHDEALTEKETGEGSLKEFMEIMVDKPTWAKGLPLAAKGWKGNRYRK